MTKNDLIQANRDASRTIKLVQAKMMHLLMRRTDYNPQNPNENWLRERVIVLTPEEFRKNEALRHDKFATNWVRASGWTEALLIHDGEKFVKENPDVAKTIDKYWSEILHSPKSIDLSLEKMAGDVRKLKRRAGLTN